MIDNEVTLRTTSSGSTMQTDLVDMYCRGAEEQIQFASSKEEAMRIAGNLCTLFENECLSNIVRNSVHEYVDGLVNKHW